MRILATSRVGDSSLDQFGTIDLSAYPDPTKLSSARHIRGACIEYRCPCLIVDGGKTSYDISTIVDVNIVLSNKTTACRMRLQFTSVHINSKSTHNSIDYMYNRK